MQSFGRQWRTDTGRAQDVEGYKKSNSAGRSDGRFGDLVYPPRRDVHCRRSLLTLQSDALFSGE